MKVPPTCFGPLLRLSTILTVNSMNLGLPVTSASWPSAIPMHNWCYLLCTTLTLVFHYIESGQQGNLILGPIHPYDTFVCSLLHSFGRGAKICPSLQHVVWSAKLLPRAQFCFGQPCAEQSRCTPAPHGPSVTTLVTHVSSSFYSKPWCCCTIATLW